MKRRSFVQASMALGSLGALGNMVGCASVGRVPEKARVIVIGGGYGGATAAKYEIDVTLIEPNGEFVSCPISNLVIGGSKTMADITTPYDKLSGKHGVNIVRDYVASVDPIKKTVTLASGPTIRYDKLVMSPGIDLMFNTIEGKLGKAAQKPWPCASNSKRWTTVACTPSPSQRHPTAALLGPTSVQAKWRITSSNTNPSRKC
jgi:sulfide dehydrogenase [flavocytochrome c] flavoprotein subunit